MMQDKAVYSRYTIGPPNLLKSP